MEEKRIGFGLRLGALIIDIVLVTILSFIIGPIIGGLLGAAAGIGAGGEETGAGFGAAMGMFAGIMIGLPIIGTLYFLLEGFIGATLGKLILGMRIARADGSRGNIGLYLFRYAIKNISFLLSLIALLTAIKAINTLGGIAGLVIFIGCFFVLGSKKQALHDLIVKSAVFKKADITA